MLPQRFFECIHRYKNTGKAIADKKALQTRKRGMYQSKMSIKWQLQQLQSKKGCLK